VVSALDAGQLPDGRAYFVMQYVPGRTLQSVMTTRGMNLKLVADLLRKIAQALDAAHGQGVIHRDLKPANIMLQPSGLETASHEEYIKIIDFGIATVLETSPAPASKDTRIVGTLPYMAPEQFRGLPSAASDIYALGVIAFEMVTGQLPFKADTITRQIELQRAGVEENLRHLRADLPEAARAAIQKAMAFETSNRYRVAREFSKAFDQALAEHERSAPFQTTPGSPAIRQFEAIQTAKRRLRWPLLIVALIALLAAAAVGTIAWRRLATAPEGKPIATKANPPAVPERSLSYSLEALHYIPFGALPDPNSLKTSAGGWRPLVVDHEIVNMPSAATLAVLRRGLAGRKPAARTVAVLADPVFSGDDERINSDARLAARQTDQQSSNPLNEIISRKLVQIAGAAPSDLSLKRLRYTRQEAERIMSLAPAGLRLEAVDFDASRATVTSGQLSQYRYIHFATHGLADSERPELSTIALSLYDEQGRPQEGFLRAHEVYNLDLPAELVTLSACETGLGKLTRGEGLVSLTRGFMYAGAARVIVSLWSVNDRATAELMEKFYRRMLVGAERPAAALRAAQVEMWQEKKWEAPYYWAAFTLQGEWR
jgi:CHAT domain-containing protein